MKAPASSQVLSANTWAAQQWGEVELGDRRLTRRAVAIGAKMAAHTEASLPNQMETRAELKGAYGLLNHPQVTLARLLKPHCDAKKAAAGEQALVLMVEDTTELDYSHHPHKTGLGPVGNGKSRGLLLHSTLAVLPENRQVLGLAHAQVVLRQPTPKGRHGWTRSAEGRVWETSVQQAGSAPAKSQAIWVHVSDRGSDIFEYLAACRQHNKHFLIRAFQNRRLEWEQAAPQAEQAEAQSLLDYIRHQTPVANSAYTVEVPATPTQPKRQAQLALAWSAVTIPPPQYGRPEVQQLAALSAYVVRAWEPNPPPAVEPVE